MIANKIESGGESGKICISEDTKMLLETEKDSNINYIDYDFVPNKVISVNSVGREINSYFVLNRFSRNSSINYENR